MKTFRQILPYIILFFVVVLIVLAFRGERENVVLGDALTLIASNDGSGDATLRIAVSLGTQTQGFINAALDINNDGEYIGDEWVIINEPVSIGEDGMIEVPIQTEQDISMARRGQVIFSSSLITTKTSSQLPEVIEIMESELVIGG